jgi:phage terminase large subunit-like protein
MILTDKQNEVLCSILPEHEYLMLCGGSRSTKTSLIVAIFIKGALCFPNSRWLISRLHLSDLKASIIQDTLPKISRLINPKLEYYVRNNMHNRDFYLPFQNGSSIYFAGLATADRSEKILGREYVNIFINEASQVQFDTFEKIKTRCAQKVEGLKNRIWVDCNPPGKRHWLYSLWIKNKDPVDDMPIKNIKKYGYFLMNPIDNPHLPKSYMSALDDLSDRARRRFKEGEWLDDLLGALWTQTMIDQNRVETTPTNFEELVIGLDPSVTADPKKSDEVGIILAGRIKDQAYVLSDHSGIFTPEEWAKVVVNLYKKSKADKVIAETNQGGDLIKHTVHTIDKAVRVINVHAKRGKILRADPVVALYQQNRVHHVGRFKKLEDQMTGWTPEQGDSPDRMDALVYAIYALMIKSTNPTIMSI